MPSSNEADSIKRSLSTLVQNIEKKMAELKNSYKRDVMDNFANNVVKDPAFITLDQLYTLEQSQPSKQLSLCKKFIEPEELENWRHLKEAPKMKSLEESIMLN